MTEVLREWSPAAIVAALEANELAAARYLAGVLGAEFVAAPDHARLVSGLPDREFNRVMAPRLATDALDAAIPRLLAPFRERDLPLVWTVWPTARPDYLGMHLERHGLQLGPLPLGMGIELARLPEGMPAPPDLEIRLVADPDTRRLWLTVFVSVFGFGAATAEALAAGYARFGEPDPPPIYDYVGLRAGVPVAAASVLPAAGIAGIYSVATVPEARRQGIGSALTLAALRKGRELGYRIAALWASSMGQPVYRRLGFEELCVLRPYRWTPPAGG